MTVTIGKKTLAVRRPADLDAVLMETTGCNAAEHVAMLGGSPSAFQVARVLVPMLAEPMDVGTLAEMITAQDDWSARDQVVALLAPVAESAPTAAKGAKADGGA